MPWGLYRNYKFSEPAFESHELSDGRNGACSINSVDIDDDGTVKLYSKDTKSANRAEQWIKTLIGEIPSGAEFEGIVKKVVDFGMFVELVPGKEGLVHISTIAKNRQRDLSQDIKNGDKLMVKVVANDQDTGRIRLIAPELQSPQ